MLMTGGMMGFHKVTVKVTNVDEPGKVTLATDTEDGTPQYLVGATLTATAEDGDITNTTQTFTADVTGEVTGVTWRWYRGGTEITGADAQDNTYTLLQADAGENIRAVVYYIVDGNTNQESASLTTDYPVLAARIGANQLEFDPATVSLSISEGAKDRNVGAPVTATGNHGTIRYTLDTNGGDAARFKIDEKTGQITTLVVLDYEGVDPATADAAGSCADATNGSPDRECTVTVIATDSTGDSTTGTDPNFRAAVTIKITNVNEAPTFSAGAKTVSVPENSTALFGAETDGYSVDADTGVTYTAMDPEGLTVSYALAGPDASKFKISSDPPVLSFVSGPDFEAKASADRDNVYEVTVRASVGGDTGEQMVRVTVGNVDEVPVVSGTASRNFAENGENAVAAYTATDPEGATPIAWSLLASTASDPTGVDADVDSADAASFTIDEEDGMLKFSSPPDFENPPDSNAPDNTYKVVVAACDVSAADCTGGQTGYHKVTVKVTQVNEPGKVTLATNTANGTPQYLVGAQLTATASDGDITNATQTFMANVADEVTGVTWRWYRGGTVITGEEDSTYTLAQADANNRIRVVVAYQVDGNTNQESASLTTDYPVLAARIGANQLEFDPATVSLSISEGAKDRNVGAPVTATGNHGTIRYTLDTNGGDAARFKIDEKTGQITTLVVLDYEGVDPATADAAGSCADATNGSPDRECTVTVIATDSTGDSTTGTDPNFRAAVTIKITNVNEAPTFSAGAKTVSVPENSTALFGAETDGYSVDADTGVTYTAMDPEGLTVSYALAGPDASKFQISGSPPVLSFVSGPDFEAKASADGDNVYEVTVRASAGGHTGEQMVRVTVGNVDEAPVIMITGGEVANTDPEFASATAARTVAEDATVGTDVGAPVTATDADEGDTLTYRLSGADMASFRINSATGQLRTAVALDFETKTSYFVTVTATDSAGASDSIDVAITVTDVEEPVEPVIPGDTNADGMIDKSEVIAAFRAYVADPSDKTEMIAIFRQYVADSAGSQ